MNQFDNNSPVLQTNEIARHATPNSEGSSNGAGGNKRDDKPQLLLVGAEDLQKIRRSNHSVDMMNDRIEDSMDCDHDAPLDRIMYPGLEAPLRPPPRDVGTGSSDDDFFEDDYFAAREAVLLNESSSGSLDLSSQRLFGTDDNNHAIHHRSSFDGFACLEDDDLDSLYDYGSLRRRQPDMTQQKVRR